MRNKDVILEGLKKGVIYDIPSAYDDFHVEVRVNPADLDRVYMPSKRFFSVAFQPLGDSRGFAIMGRIESMRPRPRRSKAGRDPRLRR